MTVVAEAHEWADPAEVFAALEPVRPELVWFDAAAPDARGSHVSVIGWPSRPESTHVHRIGAGEPLLPWLAQAERARHDDLPAGLPFAGGLAVALAYELRAETGSLHQRTNDHPDGVVVDLDRCYVFDHARRHLFAVARRDSADGRAFVRDPAPRGDVPPHRARNGPLPGAWELTRSEYVDRVAACRRHLEAGDSYELCLTMRCRIPSAAPPAAVYRALRTINPAPYGGFFRAGGATILSSSPELFFSVDAGGGVLAKPMKGTAPRGATPADDARIAKELASDPKTRAENLMIVDLLRNDLGRVCELGSVAAPVLMAVEHYASVHQLVSEITGRLPAGSTTADVVAALFPGGSMTGAPKLRTMELLDALEVSARGFYSGTMGRIGVDGAAEFSMLIRCLTAAPGGYVLGSGGAIVWDSDPESEYEEALLKASLPRSAVGMAIP